MRLPIRYNGNDIVEFDRLTVHGREAAGGYGLTLLMRGNRQPSQGKMMLFNISKRSTNPILTA